MSEPQRFIVRDLQEPDLPRLLELLGHLTAVTTLSDGEVRSIFAERSAAGIVTKVVEEVATTIVVGTASLLVERKFTRGGMCVGHVEDVVTDSGYRGLGVGTLLVRAICDDAVQKNCYKIILDCSDGAVDFYSRYGFRKAENQMRIDLSKV